MKRQLMFLGAAAVIALSGCGNEATHKMGSDHQSMDHSMHSSSGELPKGLKEAENPTFKVGSEAIMKADHMEGMKGAKATIAGAYSTTAYAVTYTPATGGEKVTNHKWVIQEEIKDAGDQPLKPGAEVMLEADHMKGMKGATAKIDSAEKTTVYMVDYTPSEGGGKVKNHKWVTESELSKE
ncbi:YdhK family protein [Metabacillus sp. RGM 3146]|uniref:YdhK family protein n=1 Tax=Metabacillus sp. RGM 3146 TaxID=3401092 RepID=UPI003B9A432E